MCEAECALRTPPPFLQPAPWKDETAGGEQVVEQERSFDSFSEVHAIVMVWLVRSPQGINDLREAPGLCRSHPLPHHKPLLGRQRAEGEKGVGREYCRCSVGVDQHGVCPLGMTDPGCVET